MNSAAGVPKVLIVDDEADWRSLLNLLVFFSFEAEISVVSSGREAIKFLETTPGVDLIICDYWMQDMTGYDVFRHLRARKVDSLFLLCTTMEPIDLPKHTWGPGFIGILEKGDAKDLPEVLAQIPVFKRVEKQKEQRP